MKHRAADGPAVTWLLSLAFLAGAASLSYEVLWSRLLTIQTGNPLGAFTLVVASYMAGLAAGAALAGHVAGRTRSPLLAFAAVQLAVSISGVTSALTAGSGGPVRWLLQASGLPPGDPAFLAVQTLVSGLGCFVPAALMGATLPLLMEAAHPFRSSSRICGLLAGAGAAGAAAGSLMCGFLLLPGLGMRRGLLGTAALGVFTSLVAFALHRRRLPRDPLPAAGSPPPAAARASAPDRRAVRGLLAVIFVSGLAVTVLEVSWTRVAQLCFGSSVQAGSLVLAAVIAGLAAGNTAGGWMAASAARQRLLSGLLLAAAASVLLSDPVLGRLPVIMIAMGSWSPAGAGAARAGEFAVMFLITLMPSFFAGAIFPVGYGCLTDRAPGTPSSRLVGWASAAVSGGHLIGAPLAFFVLMELGGSRLGLVFSVSALCLSALLVSWSIGSRRLSGAAAGLAAAAFLLPGWDPALLSSGPYLYAPLYRAAANEGSTGLPETIRQRGEIVFARDGTHAFVTVRRLPDGILSMQVNGKTDASTGGDMKTQTLTAQLPLLLHPGGEAAGDDRKVLVIGLGSGVTAASALTHPVASVEVIEILPEVVEASNLFDGANRGALRDSRTRLVVADARSRLIFGDARYDVIASQPSNPWIEGEAILFTREFFALARDHLSPGGIMCQWVQGYGLDPDDFVSVIATFARVFPHVSLWEESTAGGDYLLLGSLAPIEIDPTAIDRIMRRPAVRADLARIEVTRVADLLSHFVTAGDPLRRLVDSAEIQTEDRLSLEFRALPALHRDTLGGILSRLAPVRINPAGLAGDDPSLAARLDALYRSAREERRWAEGLGLFRPGAPAHADLLRAMSYLGAGMTGHARELVEALTRARPADRVPHLILAHLAMTSGDPAEAARELTMAVALAPDEPSSRLYLSRALFASGRVLEALTQNLEASRLSMTDSRRGEAASDRCALLLALDDAASAEAACLEALSYSDDLAEAHANLGLVRARRGRFEEARESYQRALDLSPALEDARFNLARLHERNGHGDRGLEVLRPLLTGHTPPGPDVLKLAARLSLQAGDREAARRFVERSLELDPGDEESRNLQSVVQSGGI